VVALIAPAIDSRRMVSAWPSGQVAGAPDCAMGRFSVKVAPQARQRNSYVGIASS
jgi:hypothetical protein